MVLQVVDFLPPFAFSHQRAFMRPNFKINFFQFLKPFDLNLWISIIFTMIIFTAIQHLLESLSQQKTTSVHCKGGTFLRLRTRYLENRNATCLMASMSKSNQMIAKLDVNTPIWRKKHTLFRYLKLLFQFSTTLQLKKKVYSWTPL